MPARTCSSRRCRTSCAIRWPRSAPLRTILQSPKLKPEEFQAAQAIIARQVAHMSALLDDLLDVSRITRGSFLLKKAYVDLLKVMDEAVEAARPTIDKREHTLRVERPALQMTLEADEVRLTQVLTNLLTNAAKYTPRGGRIALGTRMDGNWLVLFVRDSGVGLAPEMTRKVFDMFTQVESQSGPLRRRAGDRPGARQGTGRIARRSHRGAQRGVEQGQRIPGVPAAKHHRRQGCFVREHGRHQHTLTSRSAS